MKGGAVRRSVVLLGVAVVLAAQIPSTIQSIPNPTVRAMVMVGALIAVVVCSLLVDTREVRTAIANSLRPPPFDHDTPSETPNRKRRF